MVIEIESVDSERTLEEITDDIADAIDHLEMRRLKKLLLEFAEEIKRQSIEP